MSGKEIKMGRLLGKGDNAVIIAIDHGYMDGPVNGMENLNETITKIDDCVDGILLSPGMLRNLKGHFARRNSPIPIVRLNWSTVFCFEWNYKTANTVQAFSAADAAALGAEVVLISLTLKTGDEKLDAKNVELYGKLCNEAYHLGLPVIGECFPLDSDYINEDEMHEIVLRGCRILAELGADMIKTFYTKDFKSVIKGCPVPVFGLGGRTTPDPLESLQLAKKIIDDGARGVVFGRNAIQRSNPPSYQKALTEIVKKGADPSEMVLKYEL